MEIEKLSQKQLEVFKFINSPDYALICDGSVRSGKTTIMIMAFIIWAMKNYDQTMFAICGKTVQSAERNVIRPLQAIEPLKGCFTMKYNLTQRKLTVKLGEKENWFFVFGGRDESSQDLIQGITAGGCFFDEVALMPESFVSQAIARTVSFKKPKLWFNCNPESPNHYFYREWIENPKPNTTRVHFQLEDNPTLDAEQIERTKSQFTGIFYDRYIRGLWVVAEGLVYPMFSDENIIHGDPSGDGLRYISIDYGTKNPTAMLLWRVYQGKAYAMKEYYYDGRANNCPKTDEEYYADLLTFANGENIERVIVDPSAASFIETIRRHGEFATMKADNAVLDGIRLTATLLKLKKILIHESCENAIREFGLYSWNEKANCDKVIKENDHCLTGDTLVDTVNGQVPISDLVGKSGEVYCVDESGNATIGNYHDVRMTQASAEVYEVELNNGKTVKATAEHPFLTRRGWVELQNLREDDEILCIEYIQPNTRTSYVGIKKIRKLGTEPVYNMEVDKYHNFSVEDGIIVHNCMDAIRYMSSTVMWREV